MQIAKKTLLVSLSNVLKFGKIKNIYITNILYTIKNLIQDIVPLFK